MIGPEKIRDAKRETRVSGPGMSRVNMGHWTPRDSSRRLVSGEGTGVGRVHEGGGQGPRPVERRGPWEGQARPAVRGAECTGVRGTSVTTETQPWCQYVEVFGDLDAALW